MRQNAERYRARLADASDPDTRERLRAMLATVERELALLHAQANGAGAPPWPIGGHEDRETSRARLIAEFRERFETSTQVAYLIDPAPGLKFVAVNAAFEAAAGLPRDRVEGQPLFALFPDNPDEATADGTWLVYASMRKVAETGRPDSIRIMRYDVRDADGAFVERYWRQVNSPLFNGDGRLIFLQHAADEVTDEVLSGRIPAA